MNIDDCFSLFGQTWKRFAVQWQDFTVLAGWLIFLPSALLGIASSILEHQSVIPFLQSLDVPEKTLAIGIVAAAALAIIVLVVLSIIFTLTVVEMLRSNTPPKKAMDTMLQRLHHGIGLQLLWLLIIIILMGPIIAVGSLLYFSYMYEATMVFVLMLLFSLFFLVPAFLFLAVYFIFAFIILVMENAGPVESMRRSYNLVKGRWWWTFLYFLIYGVAYIAANLLLTFPISMPLGFLSMMFPANLSFQFLNTIWSSAVSALLSVLSLIYLQQWYVLWKKKT